MKTKKKFYEELVNCKLHYYYIIIYLFCNSFFLGVARQRLTQLRGSLLSKREILSTLSSSVRNSLFVENATKIYFRDVMDHVVLMIQRLDVSEIEMFSFIMIKILILIRWQMKC